MTDAELNVLEPVRRCETRDCGTEVRARRVDRALEQSDGYLVGAVFECTTCNSWRRIEPLKPAKFTTNGWTASRTPCSKETDVAAR